MCWVIKNRDDGIFEIGYYTIETRVVSKPCSVWNYFCETNSAKEAMQICCMLNGGKELYTFKIE